MAGRLISAKSLTVWIGAFFFILLLVSCDSSLPLTPAQTGYADLSADEKRAVDDFLHACSAPKGKARLLCCKAADLNDDGIADIVVIYAPPENTRPVPDHDGNVMAVLVSGKAGFTATNRLRAAAERWQIQFRDIDEKPPTEFIVSGYKGAKTGLGVYRVVGHTVENLFGEAMDECC
ncbi:hypothetical protein LJC47_03460 [Desulfosarcina sp. OttesenSCG-928-B08]|nr:hypothetical protein [Desulfosarcina sp. OttesenSCG-928-B08]